ncbi:putative uncharacterized protein C5orf58 homolog [Microcaecilia unicolor]|uniref:Uncharacterized protein n=1 Tax=Microcaecilia unicolor TaxID=1415580 RepID=A0A6P7YVN6_9AMPH|nr:putative uncharacterized protein C5orf58 homolog [Microcaecilia unicolor]
MFQNNGIDCQSRLAVIIKNLENIVLNLRTIGGVKKHLDKEEAQMLICDLILQFGHPKKEEDENMASGDYNFKTPLPPSSELTPDQASDI